MQIKLKTKNSSNKYHQDLKQQDNNEFKKIFDTDFQVDQMQNPTKYLPQYQNNQVVYNTSCIQDCQVTCGNLCIFCVFPFACCGCTNCCCCYELPTAQVGLVQSFGRFSRLLKPGLNMINPCSQEVRLVSLKIDVLNVGKHVTMTKDNVKLTVDSNVTFRVTNVIFAYYTLGSNLRRALIEATSSNLRQVIGQYTLDKVLQSRSQIGDQAKQLVKKALPKGIIVQNVFVEQIMVPFQIERDLNSAARQKRVGQATIINSQADVQSASLMKQSAQLLDTKAAMQIRYLQMVQELGKKGVTLMMGVGVNKKGY